MASRFHPLIATIASVRFTSSCFAEVLADAEEYIIGDMATVMSVIASVHSSAARSRSEKNGVSRQAFRAYRRCSVSPAARASLRVHIDAVRTAVDL